MEDIHGGGCKEFRVFGPPGTGKTTWLVKQMACSVPTELSGIRGSSSGGVMRLTISVAAVLVNEQHSTFSPPYFSAARRTCLTNHVVLPVPGGPNTRNSLQPPP